MTTFFKDLLVAIEKQPWAFSIMCFVIVCVALLVYAGIRIGHRAYIVMKGIEEKRKSGYTDNLEI